MDRYTLKELQAMEVLHQGQFDNLMFDDFDYRVWWSRNTVADGEPYDNKITVEHLQNGRWVIVDTYKALSRDDDDYDFEDEEEEEEEDDDDDDYSWDSLLTPEKRIKWLKSMKGIE